MRTSVDVLEDLMENYRKITLKGMSVLEELRKEYKTTTDKAQNELRELALVSIEDEDSIIENIYKRFPKAGVK